jgi:hypothetical protein
MKILCNPYWIDEELIYRWTVGNKITELVPESFFDIFESSHNDKFTVNGVPDSVQSNPEPTTAPPRT